MMGYYDIVLGLIPASFIGLTGLLMFLGLSTMMAVPLASVVALGIIGHAMFVRTPTSSIHQPQHPVNQRRGPNPNAK